MGNLKPLILRSINKLKAYLFSSLYVQKPKIKKIFIFLGFQINKRRNDKITYNQKKKKKESKDVPAVAVKLPTFMFLKKKKFFSIIKKKNLKKKLLEIKDNEKRKFFKFH